MRGSILCLLVLLVPALCHAQVAIRVADLHYPVGGYYLMYDIPSPQGVIGLTGITGGPHVFDFSAGPTLRTLTFDYVETSDGGHGSDFPAAEIAERKTENSDHSWLYLAFPSGTGRMAYGFYDSVGFPESPSVPFTPPVVDFPDSTTYGTWFSGTTSFNVTFSGLDLVVDYTFSGFGNAYGTIILPEGIGSFECIQVKYDEEYQYTWEGIPVQQSYLKSYYYLTKEVGISALIASLESGSPPSDDFSVAQILARLYDSSKLTVEPPTPVNVSIEVVGGDAILSWEPGTLSRDITYNVYSSVDPYLEFSTLTWTPEATGLTATTWVDEGVSDTKKFYRITAQN